MDNRIKIKYCVIVNALLTLCVILVVLLLNDGEFIIGPNDNLIVIGIKINTWKKYIILKMLIFTIQLLDVIVSDVGNPILAFTIFDPTRTTIVGFTKNELQFYANAMWLNSSLRSIFLLYISISQIDLALLKCIYSEFISIFTIRYLIKDKQFIENENTNCKYDLVNNIEIV